MGSSLGGRLNALRRWRNTLGWRRNTLGRWLNALGRRRNALGRWLDAGHHLVGGDQITLPDQDVDRAVVRGHQHVLHFHRLNDDERLTGTHRLSPAHVYMDDGSGHGAADIPVGGARRS